VRLVVKLSILWKMVEVDKLRNHFVCGEPVLQIFGGLSGVRAVWIVCVWLEILAVADQQFQRLLVFVVVRKAPHYALDREDMVTCHVWARVVPQNMIAVVIFRNYVLAGGCVEVRER